MNGKITRIPVETSTGRRKGFGFIAPAAGGEDVFFHATGLSGGTNFASLREGDAVEFEVEQGAKGLRAVGVVKR